mgnify:CR=1 FL=1
MLGDLQRHIDAISSSVASASEITSAHQQLQSHVVTVMQRIRASTPQFVSEEEVSHLRLVIVTLSGAVKACCVTGLVRRMPQMIMLLTAIYRMMVNARRSSAA